MNNWNNLDNEFIKIADLNFYINRNITEFRIAAGKFIRKCLSEFGTVKNDIIKITFDDDKKIYIKSHKKKCRVLSIYTDNVSEGKLYLYTDDTDIFSYYKQFDQLSLKAVYELIEQLNNINNEYNNKIDDFYKK